MSVISNESKKRVQFVNQQQDSNSNIPMKEKKLVQMNVNLNNGGVSQQLHQENNMIKQGKLEGPQNEYLKEGALSGFHNEMEKLLSMIDERQKLRTQKMQSLILQQNKENSDILAQLKELREINSKQQSQIMDQLNQQEEEEQQQQYQKQGKQSIGMTSSNYLGDNRLNQAVYQQLDGYNNNTATNMNKQRQSILKQRYSYFEDENPQQILDMKSRKSMSSNNNEMVQEQKQEKDNDIGLNERVLIDNLESVGVYGHLKNSVQVQFFQKKVENFEEQFVDGFYFQIFVKQTGLRYEFYLYLIENINEIEYNPVVMANQQILLTEESNSQLNDFYSILSFPLPMLQGFFQSYFKYILFD